MTGALVGIIGLFYLMLLAARAIKRPTPLSYFLIGFVALLQVALVLIFMFTAEPPPVQ